MCDTGCVCGGGYVYGDGTAWLGVDGLRKLELGDVLIAKDEGLDPGGATNSG
jgi:hypothetical protein